ncbi:sensor histidine kinase [Gorillibacterium sp. sgz5001074]|uniref:sensor histidine kinase n=1 Tax=Gorillibacterium sp. sgz5001074 TaxID=3446695 RepID=UPI003F67EB05
MSIRLRLTLWYSTILAVLLLVFGVALYFSSSIILLQDQKKEMQVLVREIESQIIPIRFSSNGQTKIVFKLPPLNQFKYPGYFLQAVNMDGSIADSSLNVELPLNYNQSKVEAGESAYYRQSVGENLLLVLNRPLYEKGSNTVYGILQIAVVIDSTEKILETLKLVLLMLSLITLILAASLGWFLARKALKPIDTVIAAAAQIEKGADLGVRIDYQGPHDEIGRLTQTINSMLGRIQGAYTELEESDRAQRRFVSDASHELRTPLTTIRGNVDLLEKMWRQTENSATTALEDPEKLSMSLEAMRDIAGEAARMSRLVNDLLALARADAGHAMSKDPVVIRDTVEEAARKAQHLKRTVDWRLGDLSSLDGIGVRGDKDYLQQLLFIFIENAFKYTKEGFVSLDAVRSDNQVGIRISDTGIGMDKEEVPHIFERFYRADVSRGVTSGTGLGLSIAKWIIDEHGGSIEVLTQKGVGTTFVVWLPVSFQQLGE